VAGWLRLFRALGQSLLDVLRAEAAALGEDFARSARRLAVAVGLAFGLLCVAFWLLGLLLLLAVELLALVLPRWGAVGIVTAVLVLVGVTLALLARRRWRELESPARTVGRRWADHLAWWQDRVLAEAPRADPNAQLAGSAEEEDEDWMMKP
jgi:hypothetical protein